MRRVRSDDASPRDVEKAGLAEEPEQPVAAPAFNKRWVPAGSQQGGMLWARSF
jgi:hypothetical protein